MKRALLVLAVVALYVLHQDIWFWRTARPLVFGFVPIGLFYHAASRWPARSCWGCSSPTPGPRTSRTRRTASDRGGTHVTPALIVFAYLAIVVYIGVFAFRKKGESRDAEGYFLAGRSLGPVVFLLSLFGTNMTAFAILGSSGHAFQQRDRDLRTHGLVVRARDPADHLLHGHARVGARQEARVHDAGAALPRPLGVQPHRHRDLRGAGGAAGALHHHRRDGRRDHAGGGQRWLGPVLAGRR